MRKIHMKMRGAGGFTMTELIASTMIMLMAASIITQTLISAMSYSQSQIWQSRAQNLCNLLTASVEDELLHAEKVIDDNPLKYSVGEHEYTIQADTDGKIVIENNSIINDQSYKQARAEIKAKKIEETGKPKMLEITITVSPDPSGEYKNTVSNTFYVCPLIGKSAFDRPEETP